MADEYCPWGNRFPKQCQEFHPAKAIISGVEDPLSLDVLDKFFQDAFLPNQEAQTPPEDYLRLIDNQKNFTKSMEVARPKCKDGEMRILDLASGDPQFLKLLLKNHGSIKCPSSDCQKFSSEYAKRVHYIAVDIAFPADYKESLKDILSQYKNCFKLVFEHLDLSDSHDLKRLGSMKDDMLFDMVILSNALHEISPVMWHELLSLIPDLMDDNGVFFLLDLPNPMHLKKHDDIYKSILKTNSFWEADAIYCSQEDAIELVKSMGLDGKACFGPNDDSPYWLIVGNKKKETPPIEIRRKAIAAFFISLIHKRFLCWKDNSGIERNNVKKIFRGPKDPHNRILSALRYLCLCASDTRIREYIQLDSMTDIPQ
jgi:hypothetical protein